MAPVSTRAKARRAAAYKARDKGLQELGRNFRNSQLKVSQVKASKQMRMSGDRAGRNPGGQTAKVLKRMLK